jgi:hypothetical protein
MKRVFLFFFISLGANLKFLSNEASASSLFVPDGDTALLISLASNTAQQLTKLEQLISETDKHTKLFRESVEMVEERYEVVDQLESMSSSYAKIASSRPEDLAEANDLIENLKNQKERIRELIKKANTADKESIQVKSDNKAVERVVNSDQATAQKQILKSFGSGKTFSRNMERVNAQNTALLLKESVSLNGAVNTTNGLLATQNNLSKLQVDQLISDNISKENAFSPIKKKGTK